MDLKKILGKLLIPAANFDYMGTAEPGTDMDRDAFIKQRTEDAFKHWLQTTAMVGAFIFILLCVQDYISAPDHFRSFLFYRLAIALWLAAVSLTGKKLVRMDISLHYALGYMAITGSAATVELMIMKLGGHASSYYVGQILVAVVVIGFIPADLRFHLVGAAIIYAGYLLPILAFDRIIHLRQFLTSNIFIASFFIAALILRHLSWRNLVTEIGLQYDLSRDIEKCKSIEKTLRENEGSLSRAQQIAHIGDWEWEIATNRVIWSDELYRIYGYEPHEVAPDYGLVVEAMHPDSREEFLAAIDAALRGERSFEMDYTFFRRNGEVATLHTIGKVLYAPDGSPQRMVGVAQDITERKKAEEAVVESEEKFRTIFEKANDGILIAEISEKKFIAANDAICNILGYTKERLLELGIEDIHPKEALPHVLAQFERHVKGEIDVARDLPVLRKDGTVFYADISAGIFTFCGRYYNIGIFRDITERKKAEEAVRHGEEFIRNVLDTVDECFLVIDSQFRIVSANRAYCRSICTDIEDITGRYCYEMTHRTQFPCHENGEECAAQAAFQTGMPQTAVHRHTDCNGNVIYVETKAFPLKDGSGNVTSVVEVMNNITEKQRIEEQRLKTQKLEALGTLAGGIAHDFNNLLQGVFGYITLARMSLDRKDNALHMLEQAEKALQMSKGLASQLLTFSKGGGPVKKKIRPAHVIENSVRFALSGSMVDFSIESAGSLRMVEADEGQIGQVIQNIVLNAKQAMPGGGSVRIIIKNVQAPGKGLPSLPSDGEYVEITVKDNGTGISERHLPKIFDPYFTTKEKGSGLGLATSYSIIKSHGGLIDVKSDPGRGSSFIIYLPAVEEVEEERPYAVTTAAGSNRKGRVLVMDDAELVRGIVGLMLKALGHEAEFADHGRQAVEAYRQAILSDRPFDVVILDLTVRGGMGGEETLRELIRINPYVKAVVSTGYAEDSATAEYKACGFCACLAKPYKIDELKRIMDEIFASAVS